jgi:membrane protein
MKYLSSPLWHAIKNLLDSQAFDYASSIAYSALVSLFPFLIFLASVAGFIGNEHTASELIAYGFTYLPQNVASTLAPIAEEVLTTEHGSLLTVGALGTIWTAASGIETMRTALNMAYGVKETRSFWKRRLQSALLVIFASVSMIILFIAIIGGPLIATISEQFFNARPELVMIWNIIRYLVGSAVIVGAASAMYRLLPDLRQQWRNILPGALLGSVVWIISATLFTWLISLMTDYSKTYGSLGGVVTTLLFFQFSAVIFMLGAEYNALLRERTSHPKK